MAPTRAAATSDAKQRSADPLLCNNRNLLRCSSADLAAALSCDEHQPAGVHLGPALGDTRCGEPLCAPAHPLPPLSPPDWHSAGCQSFSSLEALWQLCLRCSTTHVCTQGCHSHRVSRQLVPPLPQQCLAPQTSKRLCSLPQPQSQHQAGLPATAPTQHSVVPTHILHLLCIDHPGQAPDSRCAHSVQHMQITTKSLLTSCILSSCSFPCSTSVLHSSTSPICRRFCAMCIRRNSAGWSVTR